MNPKHDHCRYNIGSRNGIATAPDGSDFKDALASRKFIPEASSGRAASASVGVTQPAKPTDNSKKKNGVVDIKINSMEGHQHEQLGT